MWKCRGWHKRGDTSVGKIVIGICDDVQMAVMQICHIIEEHLQETGIDAKLLQFENGREVIERAEELDILFLDIEMPGLDGIETGKEIRKKNTDCKIIMATSKIERFKEAFKIAAFRFVSKPFFEEEIIDALFDALQTMIGLEPIEFYEKRISYEIPQREVCIVIAYDSFVEALVGKRRMRKDISLKRLMEILDSRLFYQIDRRYVVNLLHVSSYQNGEIIVGEEKFIVSRRRRKEFEKVYREFDVTYGGVK